MKFGRRHILFIAILLVCAILRFVPLFSYDFTYDELSGLERTRFDSFGELVVKGIKPDAHPALVQVLIYILTRCFGYVEWILKLPFLLASLGSVAYAYFFCLRNFSRQAGLFAAVIFSFSLIFVFYAPIARMYSIGVFFSLGLLYYFFEIHFRKNYKTRNFILLALFILLSALNHHVNALFALTLFVSGLFVSDKAILKKYILFCGLAFLLYIPHLPLTLHQMGHEGIGPEQGGWLDKPPADALFRFIVALFGTRYNYALVLALCLLFFFSGNKKTFSLAQRLLLILFLVNYLVVYLYSIYKAPIFQNSVMLFSGCCLVLFACSFLSTTSRWLFNISFTALTVTLIYVTYISKGYFWEGVHSIYDFQFKRTQQLKDIYGEQNVYPCFFEADRSMKQLYFDKYNLSYDCKTTEDSIMGYTNRDYPQGGSSLLRFSKFVTGLKTEYLVLGSPMPMHQALAAEHFPNLAENLQTPFIDFKVYSKNAEKHAKGETITLRSSAATPGPFTYKNTLSDKRSEFPFEAKAPYNDVIKSEGQVVLVKARVRSLAPGPSEIEVCISVNDADNPSEGLAYSAKSMHDFIMKPDSTITLYAELFFGSGHHKWKNNSTITCYIWNRIKEDFQLLDFEVQVIDYWQKKWHFWE